MRPCVYRFISPHRHSPTHGKPCSTCYPTAKSPSPKVPLPPHHPLSPTHYPLNRMAKVSRWARPLYWRAARRSGLREMTQYLFPLSVPLYSSSPSPYRTTPAPRHQVQCQGQSWHDELSATESIPTARARLFSLLIFLILQQPSTAFLFLQSKKYRKIPENTIIPPLVTWCVLPPFFFTIIDLS